jgi:hypothetical protein
MKNLNNITKKLPRINKYVFIFKKDFSKLRRAKLYIYDYQSKTYTLNEASRKKHRLEQDDIFWRIGDVRKAKWATIDTFPYWIEEKDLLNLFAEKTNRLEILDL